MVAASKRALAAMETAKMPRFYLDLRKHLESMASGETPWTPAIAVAFQVDEGIRLMNEEGQAAVFARHLACAAATQVGLERLGYQLFAEPSHRSKTVTAAWLPDGVEWKAFNGAVKARGVVLAGGQGKLTGKVFRVGHLGSVALEEILDALTVIEAVSIELGRDVEAGAAVAAAERAAAEVALQPA
jgi:aspartate aminotransferase-like enzyme